MKIYIFSFVLLLLIGRCLIKKRNLKYTLLDLVVITVSVEMFIEMGNFLEIGGISISYATIMELITLIVAIILIVKNKIINKNLLKLFILLNLVVVFGIGNLIINPCKILAGTSQITWDDFIRGSNLQYIGFNDYIIKQAIQLFIFLIILVAIYSSFSKEEYMKLLINISKYIKVMLLLGILEFVLKYVFKSNIYNISCELFFGRTTQAYNEITTRGSGYLLQGFTKESSHYAYVLMISVLMLLAVNRLSKSQNNWIAIAVFLMIASMSFSSYIFILAIVAFYILNWIQKSNQYIRVLKWSFIILLVCGVTYCILCNLNNIYNSLEAVGFLQRRIKSLIQELVAIFNGEWMIQNGSLELSNKVRLGSIFETLKLIQYRPLFGVGICAATSHGSTTMLLSGVGLVGSYLWTRISFYSSKMKIENKDKKYYTMSILIFLLVNMVNSMWLRPFYELSVIVWMISLNIIFDTSENIKIN